MAQERVDNLFASESWNAVYTAFTNVSLKAYDFDDIREALIEYVENTYPDKFNDFIASSEFIAILDLVAYLGHSLAFRTDMNTRENFFDLAERRESVLRMAKTLSYNRTRPINARGFMKITSLTTNQDIKDADGNSLSGIPVVWNDANVTDWYETFVSVLNAALNKTSKVGDPDSSKTFFNVEHSIYSFNEDNTTNNVVYSARTNISGKSRNVELVRPIFNDNGIIEAEPNSTKPFSILYRNDNLGAGSDRTGFFAYAKLGKIQSKDFNYNTKQANRTETIYETDISNSDVWVQKLDTNNNIVGSVTKVDNTTRENAIYNEFRDGTQDIVAVNSLSENRIELQYPDGLFGIAPYGRYRVWFRTTDNENFIVSENDVEEFQVTIPYIGEDSRSYNVTITLSSSSDFIGNFTGETYASVRRLAPRNYYTQDRMTNSQDYNIYPLTLGANVITKIKSFNTTYAGKSRYFDIDDVTGHHSTISVNGTDGSLFMDTEDKSIKIDFNREVDNVQEFITNDISYILQNQSLLNYYYYTFKNNTNANDTISGTWEASDENSIKGTVTGAYIDDLTIGSYLFIENEWFIIQGFDGIDIILNKPPVDGGSATRKVKTLRYEFLPVEIAELTNIVQDLSVDTFYLYYDISIDAWAASEIYPIIDDLYIKFEYVVGSRPTDTEYVITFSGGDLIFESAGQVKFYYGNHSPINNNVTGLSEQDKLYFNFFDGNETISSSDELIGESQLVLGCGPVENLVEPAVEGDPTTFDANFTGCDSDVNVSFLESTDQIQNVTYSHFLMTDDGGEIPITPISPSSDTAIGDSPDYIVGYEIDDTTQFISDVVIVVDDPIVSPTPPATPVQPEPVSDPTEIVVISATNLNVIDESGNTGNTSVDTHTITLSENDLETLGFIGNPSVSYFDTAAANGNFFFIDNDELPIGVTRDTAEITDDGTQNNFIVEKNGTNFTFTLPEWTTSFLIEAADGDIYFKQKSIAYTTFVTTEDLLTGNVAVYDGNDDIIDSSCYELTLVDTNTYTVTFWCNQPIGPISIGIGEPGTIGDIASYSVKVVANFDLYNTKIIETETYNTVGSYIHDNYVNNHGYVNNNRVHLTSMSIDNNPFGIIEALGDTQSVIVETYFVGNVEYERVSSIAISAPEGQDLPSTAFIWYNTTAETWNINIDGQWTDTFLYGDLSPTSIQYPLDTGPIYRVLSGISHVEDPYFSYRWDHYADEDRRIDPSTSNIIDVYILTSDYVREVDNWIAGDFKTNIPTPTNSFELRKLMEPIKGKEAMADHVSYIPVRFKYLFGDHADNENQVIFKVIKRKGTAYTDSEVRTEIANKVNDYFDLSNWEFGDTFYYSQLVAYLHKELSDYIDTVVITPKYASTKFADLLSISSDLNEVFLSVLASENVKLINQITPDELIGE